MIMFFLCSVSLRKIGEKLFLFYSNYYRSGVFISLFHQFASLVVLAPAVWACGVGGLPLRRYSLRVRAEYSRVPSVIFYASATSWQIERCRPARDTSNAGVLCSRSSRARFLRLLRGASASRFFSLSYSCLKRPKSAYSGLKIALFCTFPILSFAYFAKKQYLCSV